MHIANKIYLTALRAYNFIFKVSICRAPYFLADSRYV